MRRCSARTVGTAPVVTVCATRWTKKFRLRTEVCGKIFENHSSAAASCQRETPIRFGFPKTALVGQEDALVLVAMVDSSAVLKNGRRWIRLVSTPSMNAVTAAAGGTKFVLAGVRSGSFMWKIPAARARRALVEAVFILILPATGFLTVPFPAEGPTARMSRSCAARLPSFVKSGCSGRPIRSEKPPPYLEFAEALVGIELVG